MINKYQKSEIISMRALQLSLNAAPLLPNTTQLHFHEIATKEYDAGLLSCTIRAFLPSGQPKETTHIHIQTPKLSVDSLVERMQ